MKPRLGDRRARARFEIVGELWGTLETCTALVVRELGEGGALLESAVPLAPDSVHLASAFLGGGDAQPVRMLVRHCRKTMKAGEPRYLLGVQFVSVTAATTEFIRQCLAAETAAGGER